MQAEGEVEVAVAVVAVPVLALNIMMQRYPIDPNAKSVPFLLSCNMWQQYDFWHFILPTKNSYNGNSTRLARLYVSKHLR